MNEADTRAELVEPALKASGWGVVEGSKIRREQIARGRLLGAGKREDPKWADFVLIFKNQKLAVIEAKPDEMAVTEGLGQAKNYADRLQTRFAFSTNGLGIYQVDMETGAEGDVDQYPTPEELWETTHREKSVEERHWLTEFSKVPLYDRGGDWEPRYYQHNAIENALEAISQGQDRILLTLATGTGKTAIASQIALKLSKSRWNVRDWGDEKTERKESSRTPRILFLADRNTLADQAFNEFDAFPEEARVRIDPESIRDMGRVPKNGIIFFTIFQTFMTGEDTEGNELPHFGEYPPDFFDLIFIDECHRGGANDEGRWRGIMEYFSTAVQIGLTATPKRQQNADTYDYFGDPVYIYSLKEGINDGYLTPFKVKQYTTGTDTYVYQPGDEIITGDIDESKTYSEGEFNISIENKQRELQRVRLFMKEINQKEKTIVFCHTQKHAADVRDMINKEKTNRDPFYCVRVTSNDGKLGNQYLRTFRNNEKIIPTILTTSHKLSTGIDARNIRNIVLMRPISTLIEFKQIIGRGTRLFDGKDFFTIFDFVKAYEHFHDAEWDGEPEPPEIPDPSPPGPGPGPPTPPDDPDDGDPDDDDPDKREKIRVKLPDGDERLIQSTMTTSFWGPDGSPMTGMQVIEKLYGELPKIFKDERELRTLWGNPVTRDSLVSQLTELGYEGSQLVELGRLIEANNSDVFDVLLYVAYGRPPLTRSERVKKNKRRILESHDKKIQEFLEFVLEEYEDHGTDELQESKLPQLLKLRYGSATEGERELGKAPLIRNAFLECQKYLYEAA